tara:strand:+ start:166 stop:318 length:153 start_codon:yes stop_codon:yes gene_type:complete
MRNKKTFKDRLKSEMKGLALSCVTVAILAVVAWEATIYQRKATKANKEKY